ncbi:universal stress protein [Halorarum salinum]|uniref:Universal stress protein n=1 Tax=Halorarum salinum TaxID=2743089 RepID=A0A7D5Q8L4_9EURY|nr:universal stress protein [Halobaculum salinum]QLG60278.1 universal stress protein [Halobaculum salinum]
MVIVAAVDRSDKADTVMKEAATLSEAFDNEIHVVHVMTQSEFVQLERTNVNKTDDPIDMERIREIAAKVAADAVEVIERPAKTVGLVGGPAERIVDYADKNDARFIVVSPQKRSPTGKAVFGSVAQKVLLNANAPVLAVAN